jgi:hypothetical protein
MLFMVIEHFRNNDMIPIYERLRDTGRMLPPGLKYIESWVGAELQSLFPADGMRRRAPASAVGAAITTPPNANSEGVFILRERLTYQLSRQRGSRPR